MHGVEECPPFIGPLPKPEFEAKAEPEVKTDSGAKTESEAKQEKSLTTAFQVSFPLRRGKA